MKNAVRKLICLFIICITTLPMTLVPITVHAVGTALPTVEVKQITDIRVSIHYTHVENGYYYYFLHGSTKNSFTYMNYNKPVVHSSNPGTVYAYYITNCKMGSTTWYKVIVKDRNKNIIYRSDPAKITVMPLTPIFSSVSKNGSSCTLRWWRTGNCFSGVKIYRVTSSGKYSLIATVPRGTACYVDHSVEKGKILL